jgi:death-on-curing protein
MPRWIPEAAIRAIHAELLAEHGGLDGPVDEDMLGATLARPQHLETYSNPPASLFQLAAAYGFGFAKNHCFKDGNKRISLVAIDVFLQLNDYVLTTEETEAVIIIEGLAAGDMSEDELARWIENNAAAFET